MVALLYNAEKEVLKGLSPTAQATRVFGTAHPSLQLLALTTRVENLESIVKEMLKAPQTPLNAITDTIKKEAGIKPNVSAAKLSVAERMAKARAGRKSRKK